MRLGLTYRVISISGVMGCVGCVGHVSCVKERSLEFGGRVGA